MISGADFPEHRVRGLVINRFLYPVECFREFSSGEVSNCYAKRVFDSIFLDAPVDSVGNTLQKFVLLSDRIYPGEPALQERGAPSCR